MKTFQEMLNDGYTYPSSVDETTQELITSFFCYREVASNKKFVTWFNRSLNLNYPYYLELLRVDPSISSYDWFVENYMERENKHNDSNESLTSGSSSDSGSSSRTFSSKTMNTRTPDLTTKNVTEYASKQHDTFNDTTTGSSTDNNQGFSRAGALARVSPMSASYTADEMKANNSEKITVGKQSLTGYSKGFPDMDIRNPSSTSDSLTTEGRLQAGTTEQTRKTNDEDGNMSWRDGSDTVTMTTSGNEINESLSMTVTPDITTTSKKDSSESKTVGSGESHDRERQSGRNHLPSEVIRLAKSCIQTSVSFNWLYKQLDKCFMQTLDYDEDEEE